MQYLIICKIIKFKVSCFVEQIILEDFKENFTEIWSLWGCLIVKPEKRCEGGLFQSNVFSREILREIRENCNHKSSFKFKFTSSPTHKRNITWSKILSSPYKKIFGESFLKWELHKYFKVTWFIHENDIYQQQLLRLKWIQFRFGTT